MSSDELPKPQALASNALRDYVSRMDVVRQAALGPLGQAQEIAKQLQAKNSAIFGASAALRFIHENQEHYEKMRRILEPMKGLNERLPVSALSEKIAAQASAYRPVLDKLAQLGSVTSALDEIRSEVRDYYYTEAYRKALDDLPGKDVRDALSRTNAMTREWRASSAILGALSSIDAIRDNFDKLTHSSPAWAQAAELASSFEEVEVSGVEVAVSDGPTAKPVLQKADIDRQPRDLVALANLIMTILMAVFAIQQAISGGRWQAQQTELRKQQLKTLQSISALLEKSVHEQERRRSQAFLVKGRPALVRSSPYSRSAVLSKLEMGQSVKPVEEHGKWVEVEYFDQLSENYEVGWVLKKYLRRVHRMPDTAAEDRE